MAGSSAQPNVTAHGRLFLYPPRFWLLVLLGGVGAGLAGGLLMRLLRLVEHASFHYTDVDFLDGVAASSPLRRVGMLLGAGVIAGLAGYGLRWVFQVRTGRALPAGLNKAIWFRSGRLPFVYTVLRAVESIVIVGMGMSLGREGALKDMGGAIGSKLADWFGVPAEQRRVLVACAAGAGMAAAYNIPLGGALFAAEVLLGTMSFSMVLPALATSMLATASSWVFLPDVPTYQVPAYVLRLPDLAWAVLAAPVFGLASVAWVRVIGWADRHKPKGWWLLVAPMVLLPLVGIVSIWFPDLLGNGKGLVQRAFTDKISLKLLLSLLTLRFFATAACLRSGAPGGVFTPTMTFGALLGGSLGRLWGFFVAGSDVGVFAAIGSAAVLAVTTQGPISSIVMVMELTHHVDAIMVPVLLATVVASLTAQRIEPTSVYSATVHAGAEIVALAEPKQFGRWSTTEFAVVSSAAPYAAVLQRMLGAEAYCFVVNDAGTLVGELSRASLEATLPPQPLDGLTAADLMLPVGEVLHDGEFGNSHGRAGIERRLARSAERPVPVVDGATGRLVGAVQRK